MPVSLSVTDPAIYMQYICRYAAGFASQLLPSSDDAADILCCLVSQLSLYESTQQMIVLRHRARLEVEEARDA